MKYNFKIFTDDIYTSPPKKKDPTNKIFYKHIDETWSIDSGDMIEYKISNKGRFRYIIFLIDNLSKYTWCTPLENENAQPILNNFSNILTILKQSPVKLKSDRGAEYYNNNFQNLSKVKNIQHYLRLTGKGPSIVER